MFWWQGRSGGVGAKPQISLCKAEACLGKSWAITISRQKVLCLFAWPNSTLPARGQGQGSCWAWGHHRSVLCVRIFEVIYCSLLNTHKLRGQGRSSLGACSLVQHFQAPRAGGRGADGQLVLPCEVAEDSLSEGVSLSGTPRLWQQSWGSSGQRTTQDLRQAPRFPRPSLLRVLQPGLGPLPGQRLLQFGFKKQSMTWAVCRLFESALLAAAPAQVEHTSVALDTGKPVSPCAQLGLSGLPGARGAVPQARASLPDSEGHRQHPRQTGENRSRGAQGAQGL